MSGGGRGGGAGGRLLLAWCLSSVWCLSTVSYFGALARCLLFLFFHLEGGRTSSELYNYTNSISQSFKPPLLLDLLMVTALHARRRTKLSCQDFCASNID